MEPAADEIKRLRGCINDLIRLLALPAVWSGREPSYIVSTLLDGLLPVVRLEFAYARLSGSTNSLPIEVVRFAQGQNPGPQPDGVCRMLDRLLTENRPASLVVAPNPIGDGDVSIASFPLRPQGEAGVLVAGSQRSDFPTDIEKLLLQVAANEAAVGLEEAQRSAEQKRATEEMGLFLTITQAITECEDFESALHVALRKICEATHWSYGEAWILRADGTALGFGAACHTGAEYLESFKDLSQGYSFPAGIGLPGRVWASKQPEWVRDISVEPEEENPRCRLAKDYGLKAALGIPVIAGDKTLAVLTFFMSESREEDERLIQIVSWAAVQLGSVLHRKQVEQALQESEQRFRSLVAGVRDYAIVMLDPHGYVVSWNAGAERIKGYRAEEIIGKHFSCFYTSEDSERGKPERALKVAVTEGRFEEEGWRVCNSGLRFWANVIITPLWDEKRQLRGFSKVTRDISERKRAEEELKKARDELEIQVQERTAELAKTNEALTAEITEHMRAEDAIKARVREQEVVSELGQRALGGADLSTLMNEACALVAQTLEVEYCKILELLPYGNALLLRAGVGWKPGLVGRATVSAGPDSQDGHTLLSNEPVIVEDFSKETRFSGPPLLHDHGVVSGMSVIIQGQERPFGVLGAHTPNRRTFSRDDIHFLQAVANVLAEATECKRVDEALRKEQEFVAAVLNTIGALVVVLDSQGRIVRFNGACEKMTGFLAGEVLGEHVWDLFILPEELDSVKATFEVLRAGRFPNEHTNYWRTKDGPPRLVAWSNTAILGLEGVVEYVVATGMDITEIRRLHEQLVESNRLAAIGTTAAKIAHEIANPLNGMSLTAQRLERHLGRQTCYSDETTQSTMRRLRDEIGRLNRLLNDFRSLSRREQYDFQPTALAVIAGQIFATEVENYAGRGIRVEQLFPPDLPWVQADRDKLEQALWNLCKNAVEAMPQGGTLMLKAHSADAKVVLEVADTGVGIPPGIDIFEPFTTTKSSGSGLGLVVVRQVASAHGGTLTYTSEPGKGTTFRITLPQAASQHQPPAP